MTTLDTPGSRDATDATDATGATDVAVATDASGATSSGDRPDDTSGAGPVRPARARMRKRKVRLIVVGVVLAGAFGFLLIEGLTSSLNYFETVNQAVAQRAMLGTQTFRLEGVVVPGTIHPTSGGVNFTVESSGVKEPVVETGQPPQLFQPDIPVVLVGHFSGPVFASDQILVDHTSQYIAQYPSRVTAPNGSIVGQAKKPSKSTSQSAP
jgi:cytochrome c-type biogenesis protein CcmE